MTASAHDRAVPVTIRILDKEYRIACAPEEQHGLIDSARLLDERMREVRQNGRVIGADRIAVMAALNLVYELMRERDAIKEQHHRLQAIQDRLSEAIETPQSEASEPPQDPAGLDAANDKV
ncbi:cell division protein ZapA [Halochromatium glycolicum]|jgi:cell division protein ZapA|uniref:Cell division protein ZapA n=1 Tax=Halochromatium glycolicum TaxID=85075 RepID=A0AAJ0U6M6_9GAMM|nr:cell division protein ZapA [Halochromatium glycolicum]MBK1706259.1 cell division protein ZapA [Halochromatium glycolicum]